MNYRLLQPADLTQDVSESLERVLQQHAERILKIAGKLEANERYTGQGFLPRDLKQYSFVNFLALGQHKLQDRDELAQRDLCSTLKPEAQ